MVERIKRRKAAMWEYYKYLGAIFTVLLISVLALVNQARSGSVISDNSVYDLLRSAASGSSYDNQVDKKMEHKIVWLLRPFAGYNYNTAIIIVQAILLAITTIFIILISRENYLFSYVIGTTPLFIKAFTNPSDLTLIFALVSACAYFAISGKIKSALLVNIMISYVSFFIGYFVSIAIICLYLRWRSKWYLILLFLISPLPFFTYLQNIDFVGNGLISRSIIEFGSSYGISLVVLLLGAFAIYTFTARHRIGLVLAVTAVAISLLDIESGIFVLNMLFAYFTALLVQRYAAEQWDVGFLKEASIILIACTLLFSGLSYANRQMTQNNASTEELHDSLLWLKERTMPNERILTYYKYGEIIKFFSMRPVLLDSEVLKIRNGIEKYKDCLDVFQSRNYQHTADLLNKYNISLILVTKEMRQGLIWNNK